MLRYIPLKILIFIATGLASQCIYAQQNKSFRTTYPQPPKLKPSDPMAVYPGLEVPEFPDKFTWKVATPKPPRSNLPATETTAPIYAMGDNGRLGVVGQIAFGTELKLLSFRVAGGHIFYAVPRELLTNLDASFANTSETLWIDGFFLTATGRNAAAK